MALPHFGTLELGIVALIVMMLFGMGKLPEIGGALGKGIRRFRRGVSGEKDEDAAKASPEPQPNTSTTSPVRGKAVRRGPF